MSNESTTGELELFRKLFRFFKRPEAWTVIYRLVVVSLLAFIAWSVAGIPDQDELIRHFPDSPQRQPLFKLPTGQNRNNPSDGDRD